MASLSTKDEAIEEAAALVKAIETMAPGSRICLKCKAVYPGPDLDWGGRRTCYCDYESDRID